MVCVLTKFLSHASVKKKTEGLRVSNVALLLVIVWMLLAECSESISHNNTAHIKKCPDSRLGETAKASSLLNLFIRHQHGHRHMAFSITISTHFPLFAVNDVVN